MLFIWMESSFSGEVFTRMYVSLEKYPVKQQFR